MVGVLHASLSPAITIGGLHPNLLLVAVVLVSAYLPVEGALITAFVGGLLANLLVREPLGSLPVAMLLAAALVVSLRGTLARWGWLYPIAACIVASILTDLIAIGAHAVVGDPLGVSLPLATIAGAAALNAVLAGLLAIPVRRVAERLGPASAPAW